MSQWRCEKNSLESKEVWIGDKWIGPKPGRRFIFKFVEKNTRCQHPCQGVPNGSVKRVSNQHPLAFNWHPFEGPGVILFFFFSDTVQLISLFYILWYLLTKIFEVLWILCFFFIVCNDDTLPEINSLHLHFFDMEDDPFLLGWDMFRSLSWLQGVYKWDFCWISSGLVNQPPLTSNVTPPPRNKALLDIDFP